VREITTVVQIPFYFDYGCPWAYMGSCRVEAYFRDLGVEIDFRPVLLSIIREPAVDPLPDGVKSPGPGPRKARNALNDFRHWADLCGAEFAPGARSMRPSSRLLAQAALVAKDAGKLREFHYPAYRARWAQARDIADPAVVGELLAQAGLDGGEALLRARSDVYAERIEADSRGAIERGVFGVPTLFVGDSMFWGNDHFELVRHHIQKSLA
jgi:2-hydroxychromene-2-carboxylate isomerase